MQLTGGYLGASVAATPFQSGDTPIPNLYPPKGSTATERELQMQSLLDMNKEFRDVYAVNTDIAARIKSYELAARMQLSAPEVVNFANEPKSVLHLYGIGEKETDNYGRQLLMAGRDHNPKGYSVWLAGGGLKGGMTHGETDEVGYTAAVNRHYCSDLHATIAHQLGLRL